MSFFRGLFSGNSVARHILVVDVGSGSIGVALVRLEKSATPMILGTARQVIPFQEKLNVQRFVTLMQESLNAATDAVMEHNKDIIPHTVMFGLASPWNTSQTRLVHLDQPDDFLVTEKGLRQIIEKEGGMFTSAPFDPNGPKELMKNVLIESRAMQIKLNGYEVDSPIGRRARELDIALYLSVMPERIKDSFSDTIGRRWPHADLRFHSFMYAAFNAVRDTFAESASFVVVDVAGEVTDVALVRDNVLLESLSFPLGYHAITRMTMRELGLQSAAADTEVALYLEGKSSVERAKQMEQIFAKVVREWKLLFIGALTQLGEQYPIPHVIYHFVDEEYVTYYGDAMRESGSRVFGEEQGDFTVHSLDEEFLLRFMKLAEGQRADIFLCVIIMILDKLLEADLKH
ncbi:MAG TPA: hypothetical protein VJ579_00650 [Candidatus Paceibacterota bacterium]|nr:hypothetical protein [Candidatus Paceibacterota bacterium]